MLALKTTDKTGHMIAMKEISDGNDLIIVTSNGVVIRQSADAIRSMGRVTQGVRLIKLDSGDRVADIAKIINEDDDIELPIDGE